MRIYLAARYGRRAELAAYALELGDDPHFVITCTWLNGTHDIDPAWENGQIDAHRASWAAEDVEDIRQTDVLVAFTEGPDLQQGRGRGGRHVELGLAMAWNKYIIICGPRENVFHCLPSVEHVDTWKEAKSLLRDWRTKTS